MKGTVRDHLIYQQAPGMSIRIRYARIILIPKDLIDKSSAASLHGLFQYFATPNVIKVYFLVPEFSFLCSNLIKLFLIHHGHEKRFTPSLQKVTWIFGDVGDYFVGGGCFLHFLKTILKVFFPGPSL